MFSTLKYSIFMIRFYQQWKVSGQEGMGRLRATGVLIPWLLGGRNDRFLLGSPRLREISEEVLLNCDSGNEALAEGMLRKHPIFMPLASRSVTLH